MGARALPKSLGTWGPAVAAPLLALSLAGCDQNASNAFKTSFDNSFNASFDKSTHDSCVPSAMAHGATAAAAETYCTCVVGQLDKLSVQEKETLTQTPDKLTNAAAACQP